jgi:hypothetical protein
MTAEDPLLAAKASAQWGLSDELSDCHEKAIAMFQKALDAVPASSKEPVQIWGPNVGIMESGRRNTGGLSLD